MLSPDLIGSTYYLRVRVPSDVTDRAKGTAIAVPVGDVIVPTKVGGVVTVSVRTEDAAEAKRRFTQAIPP